MKNTQKSDRRRRGDSDDHSNRSGSLKKSSSFAEQIWETAATLASEGAETVKHATDTVFAVSGLSETQKDRRGRGNNSSKNNRRPPLHPRTYNGMNAFEASVKSRSQQQHHQQHRHDRRSSSSIPKSNSRTNLMRSNSHGSEEEEGYEMKERYDNGENEYEYEVEVDWTNGVGGLEISPEALLKKVYLVPNFALVISSLFPVLLYTPIVVFAAMLYISHKENMTNKYIRGYLGAVAVGLALNFVKRFFDIIEYRARWADVRGEGKDNNNDDDDEFEQGRRCVTLGNCLCCCKRWSGVWNITFTQVLYMLVLFVQITILQRLFDAKQIEITIMFYVALACTIAFVLFCYFEAMFYIRGETKALDESRKGYGFMFFLSVLFGCCILAFFILRTKYIRNQLPVE